MVFSELTNNNTVTIYTKNEVNTYFVKRIESNDISTNVILEDYNYMIIVPNDVSFYILYINILLLSTLNQLKFKRFNNIKCKSKQIRFTIRLITFSIIYHLL